jgi:hypothetical protein
MNFYQMPTGVQTRWASFENPTAGKGMAATSNHGAKGAAFEVLPAGASRTLLDVEGSGLVCRIWITISDRSPQMLRSLRLEMFWDGAATPAVSAPLGDFFGVGLGRRTPFESALFSDPEGRSFNCFIPMPFRSGARIVLTNESSEDLTHLFYDVNLLRDLRHQDDVLYFHSHWRREAPNELGRDFTILPPVTGRGRFLGCNVGILTDPVYEEAWWGEGEFKVWLDGDGEYPTLCGTGTEDYIGTAWGQGVFSHRTQGCLVVDAERGHYCFYRYHVDDPIFFHTACRVALQTIGGWSTAKVRELQAKGAPLQPVSVNQRTTFLRLLDEPVDLAEPALQDAWCNFYRQDDWSATAYFYLDAPVNDLASLPAADERTAGL